MSKTSKDFFSKEEQQKIVVAIKDAESNTSGEIRVYIDDKTKDDILDRAAYMFKKLGMQKTKHRNGILMYIALKNKQFALIGDGGINELVANDFWENCRDSVLKKFKEGEFCKGIIDCVTEVGVALEQYFPKDNNDENELPDDLIYS